MFNAPPDQATTVFAELPQALRSTGRKSHWAESRYANANMHSFLEGPSFDTQGNLYVVDIVHGRIFRVSGNGQFSVFAEYDGQPNGLKIHRNGAIYVADHKLGTLKFDPLSDRTEPYVAAILDSPSLGSTTCSFRTTGTFTLPTRVSPT